MGVAGGELLILTFVFVFGTGIKTAGTASLLVSLLTVAVGVSCYRASAACTAHDSVRHVDVPTRPAADGALLRGAMAPGSVAGAALGAGLIGWVDISVLKAVLAVVPSVSSVWMLRLRHASPAAVTLESVHPRQLQFALHEVPVAPSALRMLTSAQRHQRPGDHVGDLVALQFVGADVVPRVLHDGHAQNAATALLNERRVARALCLRKRVARGQTVVAVEGEDASLEVVGA